MIASPNKTNIKYNMASMRDISSSSRGAVRIPTPFEMSQYVQEALTSVVPGIRHSTDRVSDFLWYPNAEHRILEAVTGVIFISLIKL